MKTAIQSDCQSNYIEIKSDNFHIKQPMNTIVQGFVRLIGWGIFDLKVNQIFVNGVSVVADTAMPGFQEDYATSNSAASITYRGNQANTGITCRTNDLTYDVNTVAGIDNTNGISPGFNLSYYDAENNIIRITRSFTNTTGSTIRIRQLTFQSRTDRFVAPTTAQRCTLAIEDVDFEVNANQVFEASFIFKIDSYAKIVSEWLRIRLGEHNHFFENKIIPSTFVDIDNNYRVRAVNNALFAMTYGSTSNNINSSTAMRLGYSDAIDVNKENPNRVVSTNVVYGNRALRFHPFVPTENPNTGYFDIEFEGLATNTASEPQTFKEIGILRIFFVVGPQLANIHSYFTLRQVFDEPVTLDKNETALFSVRVRVYIKHINGYKLKVAKGSGDFQSISVGGIFFEGQKVTFQATPTGSGVPVFVFNPPLNFTNTVKNTVEFTMPSHDVTVSVSS